MISVPNYISLPKIYSLFVYVGAKQTHFILEKIKYIWEFCKFFVTLHSHSERSADIEESVQLCPLLKIANLQGEG